MFLTYANYDVLDKQYAHLDFDDYFYRKKNWDIIYIHKVEVEYLNRRLSLHHYKFYCTRTALKVVSGFELEHDMSSRHKDLI